MQIKKLLKRNYTTVDHGKKEVVKVVVTPFRWLTRFLCRHEAGCLAKLAELGFRNAPRLITSTDNSFTMHKVEGKSLRGRHPIDEPLFLRVMEVVRELHDFGFAHGNLRPNNIFIQENKEPILIDFETCCQRHSPLFFLARFRDHLRLQWLWQSRVVRSNPGLVEAMFPRYVLWAMFVIAPITRFGGVVSSVRKRLKKHAVRLAYWGRRGSGTLLAIAGIVCT
jgi:hypothetical protein